MNTLSVDGFKDLSWREQREFLLKMEVDIPVVLSDATLMYIQGLDAKPFKVPPTQIEGGSWRVFFKDGIYESLLEQTPNDVYSIEPIVLSIVDRLYEIYRMEV